MQKLIRLLVVCCLFTPIAYAQILNPVKWKYVATPLNDKEVLLEIRARIDKGWHLYSQFIEQGGPVPTLFKFMPSGAYKLIGKVTESPKPMQAFDPNFKINIAWHENEVTFSQKIELMESVALIKGSVEFMVCNDSQCLPPTEQNFNFTVRRGLSASNITAKTPVDNRSDTSVVAHLSTRSSTLSLPTAGLNKSSNVSSVVTASPSLWSVFIAGFLGGIAALFMPCIFPMLPLTVSFFTKKSKGDKFKTIFNILLYGISIIVIYVLLGMLVTLSFGSDALNNLASNGIFNVLFFALLIVFSISFFGAFEITLPSAWVNKIDSQSDRHGWVGIFFMAFSLALVSFSCTGPIIGTLLVQAASTGQLLGPALGMFGFALALAIPFTLFAIFPSVLKSLPKSGAWLNSVKVSLGFLELALSLKFLSNVDLAYHWHLLDRDIFLILWIVIFGFWLLYLLGKIRFAQDNHLGHLSLLRLFFAMLVASFCVYLMPGLWGAPLKSLSGFLPPQHTQDFDLYTNRANQEQESAKKYAHIFHAPHGLNAFYDYEEGLSYARKVGKPVLLDFTGHSCVNCRKMEASVWSDAMVLKRLKNDFVLISLYVDDKTDLEPHEQYVSSFSGKRVTTLGNKWSDLQATHFATNAQPYYVIINHEGKALVEPRAFDLQVDHYVQFLDKGKRAFAR